VLEPLSLLPALGQRATGNLHVPWTLLDVGTGSGDRVGCKGGSPGHGIELKAIGLD